MVTTNYIVTHFHFHLTSRPNLRKPKRVHLVHDRRQHIGQQFYTDITYSVIDMQQGRKGPEIEPARLHLDCTVGSRVLHPAQSIVREESLGLLRVQLVGWTQHQCSLMPLRRRRSGPPSRPGNVVMVATYSHSDMTWFVLFLSLLHLHSSDQSPPSLQTERISKLRSHRPKRSQSASNKRPNRWQTDSGRLQRFCSSSLMLSAACRACDIVS